MKQYKIVDASGARHTVDAARLEMTHNDYGVRFYDDDDNIVAGFSNVLSFNLASNVEPEPHSVDRELSQVADATEDNN